MGGAGEHVEQVTVPALGAERPVDAARTGRPARPPGRRRADDVRAALFGLPLLVLALNHGGYYATSWGAGALVLLWGAALALLLRGEIALGRFELALPAAGAALLAWIVCSILWSASVTQTMLEAQRATLYVGAALALVVVVRSHSYRALLAGAWAAIALVCLYAVATRLFPERLGLIDPIAGYRLSEPLGYWNALGLFAAMGALLALGLVAHGRGLPLCAAAGASLVVLMLALYFTFSRGGWAALACGLVASLALDPRRLRTLTALLVVGPWAALAVWLASRSQALTHAGSTLDAASRAGHRLALIAVALGVAGALASLAFAVAARRVRIGQPVRIAFASVLAMLAIGALAGIEARYGSPLTVANRAYHDFMAVTPVTDSSLNSRLFTVSNNGRIEQWRVARKAYERHPWLGSGPGTYEQFWLRDRPRAAKVLDVHNLYLEALAEMGPVGLLLVIALLGVPLLAAVRARRRRLAPAAFGAYVAYLLHAAVDWDWEMTAVTLAALICGAALLICARPRSRPAALSARARGALLVAAAILSAFAFAGLVANHALAGSTRSAVAADVDRTTGHRRAAANGFAQAQARAHTAMRWAPWSTAPWRALGEVQLLQLDRAGARASFRRALAKEPGDWSLWYGLARASTGGAERVALRRAARLNPLSPEVAGLREGLRRR